MSGESPFTAELADKLRYYIQTKGCYNVTIEGKDIKIPMSHDIVAEKIGRMHDEIKYAPEISDMTKREKIRFAKKSRSLPARCAAAILLNRLNAIPGLFSIYWRWIRFSRTSKYICSILNCGFIEETELFFSLSCNAIKSHSEYQAIKKIMEQS